MTGKHNTMRTLVLGGGGPTGAAWLGGLADALLSEQVELRAADEVLGTSAGAVLGAWLSTGEPLDRFAAAMRDRAGWHAARAVRPDRALLTRMGHAARPGHPTEQEIREIAAEAARFAVPTAVGEVAGTWSRWLPDSSWPDSLRMVCADSATGRTHVWTRSDGLTLAEGVATSTAAPGAASPVVLRDRTWVDGGVRSSTNADLIAPATAGARLLVLVLAPLPTPALEVEIAALRRSGADVALVTPDERSRAALGGPAQILDPNAVKEAARAGQDQAADTPWLRHWWAGTATLAGS